MARVEQAGGPEAVCLPAGAWASVADEFTGHSRGCVALKGKGEVELVLVRPWDRRRACLQPRLRWGSHRGS